MSIAVSGGPWREGPKDLAIAIAPDTSDMVQNKGKKKTPLWVGERSKGGLRVPLACCLVAND
jgi:hypothetical protein